MIPYSSGEIISRGYAETTAAETPSLDGPPVARSELVGPEVLVSSFDVLVPGLILEELDLLPELILEEPDLLLPELILEELDLLLQELILVGELDLLLVT